MTFDSILKPILLLAYFITKNKEKRLGFKLDFPTLSSSLIQGKVIYEMDDVWKKEGLDAIGTNYFTFGAIENGKSSRFDPSSPYFQTWLGGYIVKFSQKKSWQINDHFRLAKADQDNWLRIYGNNRPQVNIDSKNIEELGPMEINGFKGALYRGNIFSDSDVDKGKINLYNRIKIAGLALYFNQSNRKLNINSNHLMPSKEHNLKSNQNIKLRGYIAILEITEAIKVVLYANAAIYKDDQDIDHDNFKLLDNELLQMIKSIEIKKYKTITY